VYIADQRSQGSHPGCSERPVKPRERQLQKKVQQPARRFDHAFLVFRTVWYERSLEITIRLNKTGVYAQKKVPTVFLEFHSAVARAVFANSARFSATKSAGASICTRTQRDQRVRRVNPVGQLNAAVSGC
jgi:hypothetical protein